MEAPRTKSLRGPGFVEAFGLSEAQLHRLVAIGFHGLDLGHHAGPRLYDGYRDHSPVLTKHLGHSDF